ncbi:hypothetical protein PO878_17745 [Iamia majanohamensis]|uniref:DUF2510 domain-containing protein n=1 Tax=Iamia majanohamensis TaxID=467976 RepID=A0AAE9Y8M2_9ACTN|nr:hypothetical protein [Iamia majanohamensis]WCO66344.1 hypothetical protein PO878_17745 [Iamia majanohamensis]
MPRRKAAARTDPSGRHPWRMWSGMRWTAEVQTDTGEVIEDPGPVPAVTLPTSPRPGGDGEVLAVLVRSV